MSNKFKDWWLGLIETAMLSSGKGQRLNAVRHSGEAADRRRDKLDGESKHARQYRNRYGS
jgi:hypothetical protein